jgi:hypothetical protein
MPDQNDILDPAHDPNDPGTNMGAAGLTRPDGTPETKPEAKVSDDGNLVELGGKKYVTEAALHESRQKQKELSDTLARLDPVMPEFEEFLNTRESRRNAATAAAAAGSPDEKAYLEEVATALGFFDETNQPDLRRAQAHLNITRREAQKETARQVRPVTERTTRDQATLNRERAKAARFVDGQPIAGDKYVDAALRALPDEYMADSNIANITQVIAAGLEYLDLRKNGEFRRGGGGGASRGSREPMFTERGTGRVSGDDDGGLSDLDLAAARARGKSPEQWSKLSQRINPKSDRRDPSILEEI